LIKYSTFTLKFLEKFQKEKGVLAFYHEDTQIGAQAMPVRGTSTVPPGRIGWVGGWHRLPLLRNSAAFFIVSGENTVAGKALKLLP